MKPPICEFCDNRFPLDGPEPGGLLSFQPTADDRKQIERLSQPGFVGHPPHQAWFCHAHITQASTLTHLSLGEALRAMRAV